MTANFFHLFRSLYKTSQLLAICLCTLLGFTLVSCQNNTKEERPQVLVSIAPLQFFVERIAGNTLAVNVLVPPGGNPHAFEPTPKQLLNACQSKIWFCIGEPFEKKSIEVLKSHQPDMIIVDMRQGIDLISSNCRCCQHHSLEDRDTHIWLSPRLAKIEAQTITTALSKLFPENREKFEKGLAEFLAELTSLDEELSERLKESRSETILVAHPAFGYFCLDYGLNQLSIEMEGKDPSPQQLTNLIANAKRLNIDRVFTQEQYQNKGAHLIAKELNASIYSVDPYSKDYINNMKLLGKLFAKPAQK